MASIRDHIITGTQGLRNYSGSPRLDAELLLGFALGCSRLALISQALEEVPLEAEDRFKEYLERRSKREPIAYIIGEQEFFGLVFNVSPAVLIPRPETELLVEHGVAEYNKRGSGTRILDLGTGSGCVVVALASEIRRQSGSAHFTAVDKSSEALAVARSNASQHQVAELIDFRESDWFSALQGETFDIIVSNPPYIEDGSDKVSPEVHFEPSSALYAGPKGTRDLIRILEDAPQLLSSSGVIFLECGHRQGHLLTDSRIAKHFRDRSIIQDLSGRDRVLSLRR